MVRELIIELVVLLSGRAGCSVGSRASHRTSNFTVSRASHRAGIATGSRPGISLSVELVFPCR